MLDKDFVSKSDPYVVAAVDGAYVQARLLNPCARVCVCGAFKLTERMRTCTRRRVAHNVVLAFKLVRMLAHRAHVHTMSCMHASYTVSMSYCNAIHD